MCSPPEAETDASRRDRCSFNSAQSRPALSVFQCPLSYHPSEQASGPAVAFHAVSWRMNTVLNEIGASEGTVAMALGAASCHRESGVGMAEQAIGATSSKHAETPEECQARVQLQFQS